MNPEFSDLHSRLDGVLGVILAGGQGKRLGGMNKARLKLAGKMLSERAADLLGQFVDEVVLTGPDPGRLEGLGLPIVKDAEGVPGPLGGLIAGLRRADKGIVILAVDHIAISSATMAEVLEKGLKRGASMVFDGIRPVPTISFIHKRNCEAVEKAALSGARSLTDALRSVNAAVVLAPSAELHDVDEVAHMTMFGITEN